MWVADAAIAIGDFRCLGLDEEGEEEGRAVEGGLGGLGAKVVDGGADLEEAETASFR